MFVVDGLRMAAEMAYEVWWALVFGFAISVVQAWVPRERIEPGLRNARRPRQGRNRREP